MKLIVTHLKRALQEYKEDLIYLLLAGIPTLILMILISPYMDYSHLY